MIPLLIYAQAADLATFGFAASALPIQGEYNILVPAIGVIGTILVKIILVAVFALFTLHLLSGEHRGRRRMGCTLAITGILVGTVGMLSNVAALAVSV